MGKKNLLFGHKTVDMIKGDHPSQRAKKELRLFCPVCDAEFRDNRFYMKHYAEVHAKKGK